jgi:hypothetical protein
MIGLHGPTHRRSSVGLEHLVSEKEMSRNTILFRGPACTRTSRDYDPNTNETVTHNLVSFITKLSFARYAIHLLDALYILVRKLLSKLTST